MTNELLNLIIISLIPGIELRGSIPVGIAQGLDPLMVFSIAVLLNVLIAVMGFWFLDRLWDNWISRIRFFKHHLEKNRKKAHEAVEKYGYLGLLLFVAIPFPGTGAYTGTLVAWALGMDRKKSMTMIAIGVLIAGVVVTAVSVGAINAVS